MQQSFPYRVRRERPLDPGAVLIYQWDIRDAGGRLACRYIGKSRSDERPRRDYAWNVGRLLQGHPYHIAGRGYRQIHRCLAGAAERGSSVTLILVRNVHEGEDEFAVERGYQQRRGHFHTCGS